MQDNRIQYIDGLRGVAILSVVLYHAFTRWGIKEPYQQSEFLTSAFSYGWLGVNLFFAVSGYVIYMSILKSDNIFMFSLARYLRLAPAMLVGSFLLYTSSFLIPERPIGRLNFIDLLPSITFIDPGLLTKITGLEIKSLDGAFWSLYVEVKFYFIVAISYFLFRDDKLNFLTYIFFIWVTISLLLHSNFVSPSLEMIYKTLNYAGVKYYGWFLIGIISYKYQSKPNLPLACWLVTMALITSFTTKIGSFEVFYMSTIVSAIFLLPLFFKNLRAFLCAKWLLFFGYISYPLYLIHQNLVTGLAIKLHNFFPNLPSFFYPLPFLFIVILLAFLLAKYEPILASLLRNKFPNKFFSFELHRHPK